MGVVKHTVKQLQKMLKQANKDVAKEKKIAYKKFNPVTESAEMNDLAEARMMVQGIEEEILKKTTSKADLKKMGMGKKTGRRIGRGMGKALRGGGKVIRG
tara:strand:+ start:8091 stop:8390 length:300 start_codon:yes stop_codon:yes gene_type:complete